jgi:formate dehydrogenase iron-sulfur subunit
MSNGNGASTPRGDVEAIDRAKFRHGYFEDSIWPVHDKFDPAGVPPLEIESELTAGFRIEPGRTYGFFTDTTICIGCKACEVACKEWNSLPADYQEFKGYSYDNTHGLSHSTWRHVKFIEQPSEMNDPLASPRWLLMSDICKHCEHAGCLEACPTGAIIRTEFGTVIIQQDVCNGCKYCVPSCPYGVITVDDVGDGKAHKCTLCYDRLKAGMEPACAKACPTDSIQFGPVDELRARAHKRVAALHQNGFTEAYIYGEPDSIGATNGVQSLYSFFLLMDDANAYNLPVAPTLPARNILPALATSVAAGLVLIGATAVALIGGESN